MSQPADKPKLSFPKHFFWGAATSAHQVEGGNHNQWSVWELENAQSLAKSAEKRYGYLPLWDEIKDQVTQPHNYVSDRAADHYNRYEEDFNLMRAMNMNAYRFSIEWSRIEPAEGKWDMREIEHYRQYIRALRQRGLEPFVTLMHWTLPVWFADKGGFEKRRNIKYFVRFAEKVFTELGSDFTYVMTFNEPEVYVDFGYREGTWPPMKSDLLSAFWTYLNIARAHRQVYQVSRRSGRKFRVSIVKNCAYQYAGDDSRLSRMTTKFWRYVRDTFFINRVRKHMDWLGVNYYFASRFFGYRMHNPEVELNDLGWDMVPEGIQYVLEDMYKTYKVPIIVTENGVADMHDRHRKWWITQTILAMDKAIKNGAKVEGYFYWSLLDNFEWAHGHWPQFGLVTVDRKTFKRKPRASAVWLAKVIKQIRG